jgi:hypothetical protein
MPSAKKCPYNRSLEKTIGAKRKDYQPDGCVLRVTINLLGVTFHFIEDVDFVGANNKHLVVCSDKKYAIKSRFL